MALVGVWLIACVRLRDGYVRELGRTLGRLTLQPEREPVSLRELGILKETVRMLESPYERVVLQAIDLLEENARACSTPGCRSYLPTLRPGSARGHSNTRPRIRHWLTNSTSRIW